MMSGGGVFPIDLLSRMLLDKRVILLLILELVKAHRYNRHSDGRKSVRFRENLESSQGSSSEDYFDFGNKRNPSKKRRNTASSTSTSNSNKSDKKQQKQRNHSGNDLKSALKKKGPQIIHQSSLQNSNGAFDISKSTDNASVNKKAFLGDTSSIGMQLENADVFIESESDDDDGPYIPSNAYRNVGPTPEILDQLSPERFWLPPNAPITREIPGPFLPLSYGVPGQVPVTNGLPIDDYYSPGIPDYTGPRDIDDVQVDPLTQAEILRRGGVGSIGGYRRPYEVPCVLQPLNPVTPLPGGNIIDPLSPQVNNVRGPFFPNQPRNDGAFLMEAEQPQLVARDLEDGPYIVERVTDPIVFFDPTRGQTVLFDPIRDFTRLYNPETDPELPIEDEDVAITATEMTTTGTSNGSQPPQQPQVNRLNGGGFLKSMSNTNNGGEPSKNPAFWILKRLDHSELEKSGGINGNPAGSSNGRVIFESASSKALQPPQPPAKPAKKQTISHYKAPVLSRHNPQARVPVENFRIQLASTKDDEKDKDSRKVSKTDKTENDHPKYKVTLVYRPIVDIDLKKRYSGFKAQRNDATATSNFKPSIITTLTITLLVFTLAML